MSSLRDAVLQDLRFRMEERPCDDDAAVPSPFATRPAPGTQEDELAEDEEGMEEELQAYDAVVEDEQLQEPPSNSWMKVPSYGEQPVEPQPEQDAVAPILEQPVEPKAEQPVKPEPDAVAPILEQPVEPKAEQPVKPKPDAVEQKPDSEQPPAPSGSGVNRQESIEFAASDVEEAPEEPSTSKKPSANFKAPPKAKTEAPMKRPAAGPAASMKRPAAGPGGGSAKKRPASAVECETEEKEKPSGPRSVMDIWPWVDIPDGPHLRECKVGKDWQAGLPTQFAVY